MRTWNWLSLAVLYGTLIGCGLDGAPNSFEASISADSASGVIYGADSITYVSELHQNSPSSVSLFTAESYLAFSDLDGVYTASETYGRSAGVKWADDPSAAYCSGVLLRPDLVLTAGHCVTQPYSCDDLRVVLGYERPGNNVINHPGSAKYKSIGCKKIEIVKVDLTGQGLDYALIRLEKPLLVPQVRVSLRPREDGEKIYTLGYPLGTFKKRAEGEIRSVLENGVYVTTLDVFEGNSGSPVFSSKTDALIGILSGGEADFNDDGSVKKCLGHECSGEFVIPIQKILADTKK